MQLTFEQPTMLWFLFAIPLLLFTHIYFMHHARKQAIRFGNFSTIERVTGKRLLTKNLLLLLLRMLIILCLVFAAAGTTLWRESSENIHDIVIVIDASASMTTEDMGAMRIDAAKEAAKQFVRANEKSADIAVVQFSGLAEVVTPPTRDKEAVIKAIDKVQIKTIGGTDVAGALVTGTNILSTSPRGHVILLMTDGVSSVSLYDENPIPSAIRYANDHHVVVHTIGIGTQTNSIGFLPDLQAKASSYDEQNLQAIANATGGTYAWARNPAQLESAYERIVAEGNTAFTPLELSYGFLFTALLLIFIEWGLLNTRYRILP